MNFLVFSLTSLLTFSTQAASVGSCIGLDSIGNLTGNPVTFADGAIRVAHVSTEEPALTPDHLLVFIYGEEMSAYCFSIDAYIYQGGFGNIEMDKLKSSYDTKKGLLLTVPASVWTGEDGVYKTEILKIRINRAGNIPVVISE